MTVPTREEVHAAYYAAKAADEAWHADLVARFGRRGAIEERYRTASPNSFGPRIGPAASKGPLYEAFRKACDAYFAMTAQRRAAGFV